MSVFTATRRVAVTPDVAFAVAVDVASYSQFLPLMNRSVIRGSKEKTAQGERFEAELAVAYPKLGLVESFVSRVETFFPERRVRALSQDGPFRALTAEWMIKNATNGCDVSITIDYAFRNPLLQIAAGAVMNQAVQKVMTAFEARAKGLQATAI